MLKVLPFHTHMHVCMHARMHTCTHARTHAWMHTCMHACTHTYTHIHIFYVFMCPYHRNLFRCSTEIMSSIHSVPISDEVAAALKKMKKHKAPGLTGLVAEMIQTTGVLELSGYWTYVIEL